MLTSGIERILIIAPHADDEVLGCGGLIEKACRFGNDVKVVIMTVGTVKHGHKDGFTHGDTRKKELKDAMDYLGCKDFDVIYDDKDGLLDTVPKKALVAILDKLIANYSPTMVFIPLPSHHQDHIAVYEACLAALRPGISKKVKLIAMYEYPLIYWQHKQFWNIGELYLDISNTMDNKIEAFRKHKSQIRPASHPISPESIEKWAGIRGVESGLEYAEKYYVLQAMIF